MQLIEKKSPGTIGLIGHTIINYPDPSQCEAIVATLVKNNAALIELQIPFSEPIADGPLFAKANHEAIEKGITLADCFAFMATCTKKYDIPFVFMTYANILFKQGFDHFLRQANRAGARGIIVSDLPLDIADGYLAACKDHHIAAIPVVAPNITTERLAKLSPFFDGFVYAVARSGVTGSKTTFEDSLQSYITLLRNYTSLPIALGFGIAHAEDIRFLTGKVDYAVVGTETLRVYREKGIAGVDALWQSLNQ